MQATLGLLAVAAVVAAAGSGCKDRTADDKKPATESPAPAPRAVEGLEAIPAGVRAVVGVDVKRLAASPLVQRAVAQMFARDPELQKRIDALVTQCKLEPAKQLSSFVIGMGEGEQIVLAATGTFRENDLALCVDKALSADGGRLTTQKIGAHTAYRADSGPNKPPVWFAFGSEDTLIVSSAEAALAAALGDGKKVADDPALRELIARAQTDRAAVWGAGSVPAEVGDGLRTASDGQIGPPTAMFGHLVLETGLEGELGAIMATAEDANSLVSFAKPQLDLLALAAQKYGLGRLVRKLDVSANGSIVRIRVSLTDDELRELLSRIDTEELDEQNPTLDAGPQGAGNNGKRDAAPDSEAPVRQQRKAD